MQSIKNAAHKLSVDMFLDQYSTILLIFPCIPVAQPKLINLSLINIPISPSFSSTAHDQFTHLKSINCFFVLKFSPNSVPGERNFNSIIFYLFFLKKKNLDTHPKNRKTHKYNVAQAFFAAFFNNSLLLCLYSSLLAILLKFGAPPIILTFLPVAHVKMNASSFLYTQYMSSLLSFA